MRRIIVVLSTAFAVGMGGTMAMAAATEGLQAPTVEIIIEGRKPARFDHQTHLALEGVTCGQCHHDAGHQPLSEEVIGAMANARQLACVSCHNQDFANEKLRKVKDAFHRRCKGCHKTGVAEIKGPTKCKACHLKKKK
ncbi:MAG: cytochrome c family protein [Desulfobacterales bacterium]|nr:cytochrome c family protein [Desulfobacterales bacterium]